MTKLKHLTLLVGCSLVASSLIASAHAMNIQPDPLNPTGYIISRADVEAVEKTKTADPMYGVWAQALRTLPNVQVEAIEPGLATNPVNVKRAERVFPYAEWDFLTKMLRQNIPILASYVR